MKLFLLIEELHSLNWGSASAPKRKLAGSKIK
jgi:hypothetical protein